MWVFICFNFSMVFLGTWMYLGGGRRIKSVFHPQARQAEKKKGDEA